MNDRDPELARKLELYRQAKAPPREVRERVWESVQAQTRGGPEAGTAPSRSGAIKLVVLAAAIVGLGGLWMARGGSESPSASVPVAAPAAPVAAAATRPPAEVVRPAQPTPRPEVATTTTELTGTAPAASDTPALTHAPRAATHSSADRPQASSLAEELELLTAAQHAAQRGAPRAALALLDQHGRRFPDGAMAEEREAERVTALCALGREDEARRVADTFLTRFVGSPQSARVSRACAAPEGTP